MGYADGTVKAFTEKVPGQWEKWTVTDLDKNTAVVSLKSHHGKFLQCNTEGSAPTASTTDAKAAGARWKFTMESDNVYRMTNDEGYQIEFVPQAGGKWPLAKCTKNGGSTWSSPYPTLKIMSDPNKKY